MTSKHVLHRFELLRTLLRLSQEQQDALAQNRLDQFVALLDEREALIGEFAMVDAGQPEPNNVIPFPGTVGPKGKADARSDDSLALESLLRAVIDTDAENERALREGLADLREAIGQIGRARVTARGYRPIVSALATAIDQQA